MREDVVGYIYIDQRSGKQVYIRILACIDIDRGV